MQEATMKKAALPRRTLNRLALALLALAIGGGAQSAWNRQSLWDGLLLYGLAALLFVRALGEGETRPALAPGGGLFVRLRWAGGWRQLTGGWLLAIAVAASVVGYGVFANDDALPQAWRLYTASLGLFIAAVLLLSVRFPPLPRRLTLRPALSPHTLLLLLILLLALALRLWRFGDLPFGVWYDEAEAGLQARRWLSDPLYRPPFYDPINITGQFLFLYSRALRFLSDTVQGMRAVSVAFGMGSVLAAYLVGRRLRGARFGLAMAFLLAVMRWDINFSRIAMTGVDAPFFELLTLYFLLRLAQRGRLHDAAWAGLSLGLGLCFYTAFRLFVLAVGLFALAGGMGWLLRRRGGFPWRRWGWAAVRLAMLLLATWLAVMPVAQYALRHPDSYWARVRTTSILNHRDDPDLPRALRNSLGRHLAMFHLRGDRNGRHNLPGKPMLDPAMGVLMVLGFALALRRLRRPANAFFLLLFFVALSGGVFSLDFEAPQSLRSIGVLPAVVYFCALPVEALASEARRVFSPPSMRWLAVPAGLAALYVLSLNARLYFGPQADDFAVWNAFSTPETITGRKMAQLGPGYDFYLSPFLTNHPTIRFLSPDTPNHRTLPIPDALPIRTDAARPVALFIHPDEGWVFEEAQRLYPAAYFETASNKPGNPPSVHIAVLSPEDIASVQGLELRYWAGATIREQQVPARALRVDGVDADWSAAIPLTPPFVAEWRGILYADPFGVYALRLSVPARAALEIDGRTVFDGEGEQSAALELARGNHLFRLRVWSQTGRERVQLRWQPPGQPETVIPRRAFYTDPVTNHGLLGRYFANPNWEGEPSLVQIDPFVDTYFHLTPLPRPYSVEWVGMLDVPADGVYGLGLRSVGAASLFVDDRPVAETTLPNRVQEGLVSLPAGLHSLRLRFRDDVQRSEVHLLWTPPGAPGPAAIPSANLWPPLGDAWQPPHSLA
ncbi:MAG: hypothetical protein D6796_16475, partial [Caldilineae bacterium]